MTSILYITIVEEQTKRLSRNLALTEIRRRVITFEEPRNQSQTKVNSKVYSTFSTEKSLRPVKDTSNSTMTTTTVVIPYKHFKIWTDYDEDMNLLLHIKEHKKRSINGAKYSKTN